MELKNLVKGGLERANAGLLHDATTTFKAYIDTTTGFLTSPVKLARTGVQYYYGFELGLEDRKLEKIGVYRPDEEVFHLDSIKSFTNLVVTDDHPSGPVTIDNVKKLQVGSVSQVEIGDNGLFGIVTITDKVEIEKIKDGKIEVSVGYEHELEERSGIDGSDAYEFVQTNIRANHLAIVDAGRCGSACKLTIDHNQKEKIMIVTIDGIKFDVEDAALAQAIDKRQASHDAEKKALEEKVDEEKEEKEKMKKEKDKVEAEKDALMKDSLDDAAIATLVHDRALLLATAKEILGDKMLDCEDCPRELKVAVADHVIGVGDLSGKSDDYINAMFDAAVVKSKKAKDSIDNLNKDFSVDKKKLAVDRETARDTYMKDIGLEVG